MDTPKLQPAVRRLICAALLMPQLLWPGGCATQPAAPAAMPAPAAADEPRITILYDAFGRRPGMQKDWGFAALVEANGKRILFDTGDNPDILAQNVRAAGVDLKRLDFVVISHRHSDHMGGLTHLLAVNPKVTIYAPKEGFGVFGSSLPSSFYRKDATLAADMRYYDGQPPEIMSFGTAWPGAHFTLIDKTTEVAPGVTLIALVSEAPGTRELKELSLAIDTPHGMVLVVGCSHPGIEAVVAEAAKIDPHIHLIAGGLHLLVAQDPAIEKIVQSLKETWKVEWIAPGHCTGEPTFTALQRTFGERYLYAGLGTVLHAGATPGAGDARAGAGATTLNDWREYRALLAANRD
jgi:7,8-dihydropterin-6-yl-methyl-4-(beta-D-ribofuranosyl)aminobenzene 5'-phosphate synthase